MRMNIAAAAVAAGLLACGTASASEAPKGKWGGLEVKVGDQQVCSIFHRLADDQAMVSIGWRSGDGKYIVILASPLFMMSHAGQSGIPVKIGFDDKSIWEASADVVAPGRIAFMVGPVAPIFVDGIRDRKELDIQIGAVAPLRFPLNGSAAVVVELDKCITKNGGSTTAAPAPQAPQHYELEGKGGFI